MKKILSRPALAIAAATVLLSACGGGDDGGGGSGTPAPGAGTEVPSSALADGSGLVAYLKDLIATRTDNTSEPVVLGTAVLPVDDVGQPLPLN